MRALLGLMQRRQGLLFFFLSCGRWRWSAQASIEAQLSTVMPFSSTVTTSARSASICKTDTTERICCSAITSGVSLDGAQRAVIHVIEGQRKTARLHLADVHDRRGGVLELPCLSKMAAKNLDSAASTAQCAGKTSLPTRSLISQNVSLSILRRLLASPTSSRPVQRHLLAPLAAQLLLHFILLHDARVQQCTR